MVARTNLPESDLAVGTVDADFPAYAALYERDDEVRRTSLVFGKGRWKGEEVRVDADLRGWRQADSGPPGILLGTNVLTRVLTVTNAAAGLPLGDYLVADFDRTGGDDEAFFTVGDSGGPVFVRDCGDWKLAGIASAIDGPFQRTADAAEVPFLAALFDTGGLFVPSGSSPPELIPQRTRDQPASWYACRILPKLPILRALAGLPQPVTPIRPTDLVVVLAHGGSGPGGAARRGLCG